MVFSETSRMSDPNPAPRAAKPAPSRLPLHRLLTLAGPYIGLALVLLLFSLDSEVRASFLTPGNLRIVAAQTVIVAIGALGMTLIIVSGGIDLSVGSTLAMTSVVAAILLRDGHSPWAALCAAILLGGLVGVLNGVLITRLRVTPFIVTLGTLGIARGVASWLGEEQSVSAPATWLNEIAATFPNPSWLVVAPGVWIALILALLTAVLLRRTRLGRYIVAIGSNETSSRLSGLRVDALKVTIYGLAGLYFGLAGAVQFSRLGLGDPTVAVGAELDIIAAVVIGGGSLSGGEGSVLGSVLGALIMTLLRNGSQQMGWPAYVQQIIIGIVIVAAVALDQLRHRVSAH